ncbi:MAG: VWA domain-containing protein [Bacteroidota bacterium]
MSWLNQFSFSYLWVLPLLAVPWLAFLYRAARTNQQTPSLRLPDLGGRVGGTWRSRLRPFLPLFRAVAMSLLILALARPRIQNEEVVVSSEGIEIMLAIDLSSSMGAQDFQPNRLEAAKAVAVDFVGQRLYDRVGLVVFAAESYTQAPPTVDHDIIVEFLSKLETGLLEDGTAIGTGLATAVNRLKDSEIESKIVVLLTDGENNAGEVSPSMAAELARVYGIRVYTIAMGSGETTLVPSSPRGRRDYRYSQGLTKIDENILRYIADHTGGRYFRARNRQELDAIYDDIDQLERTEIETSAYRTYDEYFGYFLGLGLLVLIVEFFLRYGLLRVVP